MQLEERQRFGHRSRGGEGSSRGANRNGGPSNASRRSTGSNRAPKSKPQVSFSGLYQEADDDSDLEMGNYKQEEGEEDEEDKEHGEAVGDILDNARSVSRSAFFQVFHTDTHHS